MASRTFHFKKFSVIDGDVKVHVDLSRFDKQFQDAQYALDGQVMHDMLPFMPMIQGNFIRMTEIESKSLQGSGVVCAGAGPFGRFLYEGKLMVDEVTGSAWARKGRKKITTATPLKYTGRDYIGPHPDVTDHWFDAAKKIDLKNWVNMVKRIAGGGKRG